MYFDFIADNMKQDIYSETFKTVGQLINYGIEPEVAFYIQRPRLNWLIKRSENDSVKIETILHSDWASAINRVDNEAASDVWQVALESTIREVPSFLPKSALDNISCHFYVTFWQLSLYDIDVPAARYETEIKRLQLRLSAGIDKDNTVSVEKKASEKERVQLLILQFEAELKAQDLWNTKVMNRLMLEKDNWFTNSLDCHATSVQYCFLPRCLFSPSDAIFCAKFLFTMHKLGTHNFFTWLLIENVYLKNNLDFESCDSCCDHL